MSTYSVRLTYAASSRSNFTQFISVIKLVREAAGHDLVGAKRVAECWPITIKIGMTLSDAQHLRDQLELVGAKASVVEGDVL